MPRTGKRVVVTRSPSVSPRTDVPSNTGQSFFAHAPDLTRSWGVFLAFVGIMTFAGIFSVQMARNDLVVIAITVLVLAAIGVALFARMREID
jgi:hypothetical protein